jgi:diguanylate cyclase (GGDEF)-like protein
MRPVLSPSPPPDSVEPRARVPDAPAAVPGTGPAQPTPEGRVGEAAPRARVTGTGTAQARTSAGKERRGIGRSASAPPPPGTGPADAQHLPVRRPRIGLPILLPAIGAAVILLAHGLIGALIYGLGWSLSPGMLLVASAACGLIVSVAVLWSAGRWLGRRIGKIIEVLERSQAGDYSQHVVRGLHDDVGMLAHNVNLLVSKSAAREKRIIESALSDPLTGLPNRTLLTERIRHSLAISRRVRTPFCIAVVDLDRFKFINDTLGHAAGDTVLREVARRLRATVRETDTVARLGGDEFVLLLVGGEDAGREVCTRILAAMRTPLAHRDQLIDIGLSMGLSVHPQHGDDDEDLVVRETAARDCRTIVALRLNPSVAAPRGAPAPPRLPTCFPRHKPCEAALIHNNKTAGNRAAASSSASISRGFRIHLSSSVFTSPVPAAIQ